MKRFILGITLCSLTALPAISSNLTICPDTEPALYHDIDMQVTPPSKFFQFNFDATPRNKDITPPKKPVKIKLKSESDKKQTKSNNKLF